MSTIKRTSVKLPVKKSVNEDIKEGAVAFIFIIGIYWVLSGMAKILTAPFRILFISDKERFEKTLERAKEKVLRRKYTRETFKEDPNNFINQYNERYHTNITSYYNDPDNVLYERWYNEWVNGKIRDAGLQYAPEMYEQDFEGNRFVSTDFILYLRQQVEIHMESNIAKRHAFLHTIDSIYPEFTPKFSVILEELSDMEERSTSLKLKMELIDEIYSIGIPMDVTIDIVNSNLTIDQIKENLSVVKVCSDLGYGKDMCGFCIRYKFDPNHRYANTVNLILDKLWSDEIALALIKENINPLELDELCKSAMHLPEKLRARHIKNAFKNSMRNKTQRVRG